MAGYCLELVCKQTREAIYWKNERIMSQMTPPTTMSRDAHPAGAASPVQEQEQAQEQAHASGDEKLLQEQELQSKRKRDSWEAPACSWARTGEDGEDLMDAMSTKEIMLDVWRGLSWTDRLLSLFIIVAMILGVVIGEFADVRPLQEGGNLRGVSAPLVVGLLVMMWPILAKVQYEQFPRLFRTWALWRQITLSLVLNWVLAPFLMLGLASATLPDLPTYRVGIIMVGVARCIAMVMIWTAIAKGETNICAIIVIVNSLLQIVAYAPLAVLQINVISDLDGLELRYDEVAIAVLIYLGIPLAAGVVTRFSMMALLGKRRFHTHFLPYFSPLSLLGLLYTIIIIFAEQSQHVLDNLGPVFRCFVPLILYFALAWIGTFAGMYALTRRYGPARGWTYEMAATQAFTAASNNFELAISLAISQYGAGSDQALAASIGPLVEVPVLLLLSFVALFLGKKLRWNKKWKESVLNAEEVRVRRRRRSIEEAREKEGKIGSTTASSVEESHAGEKHQG